jgi:hypothetical protein
MALRENVATCANRVLVAGSTNSAGRWICRQYSIGISIKSIYSEELSETFIFYFFSVGCSDIINEPGNYYIIILRMFLCLYHRKTESQQ